jgi:hypothetical protein
MTAAEFSAALDQLKMPPKAAADWFDTNERTIRRWRDGEWPVPHLVELLLMELLLH